MSVPGRPKGEYRLDLGVSRPRQKQLQIDAVPPAQQTLEVAPP
jgi:hypothetical protein